MGKSAHVEPDWQDHPVARWLSDFDRVERLVRGLPGFMALRAYRVEIEGQGLFIKYYQSEQDGFRLSRIFGAKPRRECRNLKLFRALGVAAPDPVATGVERRWGVFRSGYLATMEVTGAEELAALASREPERLADSDFYGVLCAPA